MRAPLPSSAALTALRPALPAAAVGLALAAWSLWLHGPAIGAPPDPEGGIAVLGLNPDALDAAWGLRLLAQSDRPGPWTTWIAGPEGAIAVYSPWFTGRLLAPIQHLFEPARAYVISIALTLALGAAAVSWLARERCGRWGPAALVAAVFLAQPATLQLALEGSAEHAALWTLPAALAAGFAALRTGDARFAAAAGLLVSTIPLDSPYGVAYATALAPIVMAGPLVSRWRRGGRDRARLRRIVGAGLLAAAPILLASAGLFAMADLDRIQGRAGQLSAFNSVSLRGWAAFQEGGWQAIGVGTRPALDLGAALAAAALSLLGGRRAWVWLAAGALCLGLSFGSGRDPEIAAAWFGAPGAAFFEGLASFNGALDGVFPFSFVRFPWRWAPIAAIALAVGAAIGLGRLMDLLALRLPAPPRAIGAAAGLAAGLAVATALQDRARYRSSLPYVTGPDVAACQWLRDRPGPGGVLLVPTFRQPVDDGFGVFARLGEVLTSRDSSWLQLLHGRPQNLFIDTVPTLIPLGHLPEAANRLVWNLDAAAESHLHPGVTRPVSSEPDPEGADDLLAAGYRFVVLDEAAFGEAGLAAARAVLAPRLVQAERFDDGRGITVLELGAGPDGER